MMGPDKPPQIICPLLELLKDDKRLPAPAGCPTEVGACLALPQPPLSLRPSADPFSFQVHALMLSCWTFTPSKRPTFGELAARIEALQDSRSKVRG